MADFKFRVTTEFETIANHLSKYCGISKMLSSKRLHQIKLNHGFGGADNVTFDFSGGVYNTDSYEFMGSLTEGGAREKAQ